MRVPFGAYDHLAKTCASGWRALNGTAAVWSLPTCNSAIGAGETRSLWRHGFMSRTQAFAFVSCDRSQSLRAFGGRIGKRLDIVCVEVRKRDPTASKGEGLQGNSDRSLAEA